MAEPRADHLAGPTTGETMRSLIQRLRTGLPPTIGEHTDERLLDDFLAHRGAGQAFPQVAEEAFATIVRRHGPMVRGVCRRLLRNDADADDAFQAVFVVLLRKAEAVRPRNQLGNWLYGVAVNVARRGRDAVTRRRTQELVTDIPGRDSGGAVEQSDLRAVIDQELSGLPDAYRAAVVACDLEGHTRAEAAGRLGWSEGTVASRLARGRALLADRLTRRGVAIPAVGLTAALGTATADALPVVNVHLLVSSPSPTAEALAKEAIRAMTTNKLKTVAVALLAAIGLAGVGTATVWACGGLSPRPNPPVSEVKPFPLSSIEANEPKPETNPAVWEKPAPKAMVAPGIDRPAGEGVAGIAKPAQFVMLNPAKDITIVSDRHETFVEFFKRQPVLIAHVPDNIRDKILFSGKGTEDLTFLGNASFNVDGTRAAVYGASVKLAPVPFDGSVYRLLDANVRTKSVIFVRDAADKDLWHAVGFTNRQSFAFFASTERVKPDDFAPADLIHHEKTEKKGGVPAKPPEMKPTRLANPAKDIVVISDRDETIPEFFRRQRVYVGSLDAKAVTLLALGQGTPDKVFVNGTSTNDGKVYYGTNARIATPPAPVVELLVGQGKGAKSSTVFFLPDPRDADVYHAVGFTTRDAPFFFDNNRKSAGDDFTPADLKYAGNVGIAPPPPAKQFVLTNATKDITVLSDRDETLPEFFRRQSVVVGPLHAKLLETFTQHKFDPHETQRESIITNPSYNDRPYPGQTIVGVRVMLPTGRMRHLLTERLSAGADQPFAILIPDATERGAYQLIGFTDRKHVPFFGDTKKATGDTFAPADFLKILK